MRLFDNPKNLKEWQDGFISTTPISGKQGAKGSKSAIKIRAGKSIIEMTETILVKNLPDEMTALYEHKQTHNTATYRFKPVSPVSTQWTTEIHYTKYGDWTSRLIASVFPGIFRKQTQKWLENFKRFAERN